MYIRKKIFYMYIRKENNKYYFRKNVFLSLIKKGEIKSCFLFYAFYNNKVAQSFMQ